MKPTMTLRFGAAHNSLTIHEQGKDTLIELNTLTRDDSDRLRRMAVEAWQRINNVKRKGKRRRKVA